MAIHFGITFWVTLAYSVIGVGVWVYAAKHGYKDSQPRNRR